MFKRKTNENERPLKPTLDNAPIIKLIGDNHLENNLFDDFFQILIV